MHTVLKRTPISKALVSDGKITLNTMSQTEFSELLEADASDQALVEKQADTFDNRIDQATTQ